VALRKAVSLAACEALVAVVSPEVTEEMSHWAADAGAHIILRPFLPEDVDGAYVVIAATDNPAVNESVAKECRKRGILVNVVDTPDLCDFYVPASLSRGDLVITIGTGGKSPMLAKRMRMELERQYGPEYGPFLELMGRLRLELQARVPDIARRTSIEAAFLSSGALDSIAGGRLSDAEQLLEQYISQLPPRA
jgi:precorrin-2 dehydrogenase/sirohydrochlorin ferrochelatase